MLNADRGVNVLLPMLKTNFTHFNGKFVVATCIYENITRLTVGFFVQFFARIYKCPCFYVIEIISNSSTRLKRVV